MRLIVDGNSVLNAALLRGVDDDEGKVVEHEGKKVQVNSAQYGVDGFFDKLLEAMKEFDVTPMHVVVVWDGKNAKMRRRQYLETYKAGRDKAPEVSEQLNLARDTINGLLKDMGTTVVVQDGYEADDVIGYLCNAMRRRRNVVMTSDGDLTVLVDDNTSVWRLGELDKNPYGPFPHKFVTLYKALVGDNGDKIPGAKGFGDAAFVNLVRTFGLDGLQAMQELIENDQIDRLREDVADLPALQKIIDAKAMVTTSWICARLMIEEINTLRKPLGIIPGMVKQRDEMGDRIPGGYAPYFGTKTLVHASNYERMKARLAQVIPESPFVPLDIETSSTEASDEWMDQVNRLLERKEDKGIDVLGHELTGMSLTFGDNLQHTIYATVDHLQHGGIENITVEQCRQLVELIPKKKLTVIQNCSFEFSVLYRTWGEAWKDNGWQGFVPNAIDTKIGASYVDENLSKGLKQRSKHHLGYEQTSYEETTTFKGPIGTLAPGGKRTQEFSQVLVPAVYERVMVEATDEETGEIFEREADGKMISPAVTEAWEARQYKMRELTAEQVFDYGCDDTICTGALHNFYELVMDIEGTYDVYMKVEQLPAYLTALAFVQGIPVNLGKVREMEKRDDETWNKAWATLREFLFKHGWAGTYCPEFEGDIEPSDVKMAAEIILGEEFTSRKRKLGALAAEMREKFPDNDRAHLLAEIVERNAVNDLNALVKANFTGDPKINFGSPQQMQRLFYEVIGIKPRIINALTQKQRDDPTLKSAMKKFRQEKDGKVVEYTGEERRGLISKASTDDSAVDAALVLDNLTDEVKTVLRAYADIKKVMTRRNLFYKTYKALPHWRDNRLHPSLNQCEAVTRRYSASGPNVQQMPARGEGAEFRSVVLPHHRDAVIVSCDFAAQEVRSIAEQSGDPALISCYVGDNLYDIHSLTAVAASKYLWDTPVTYEEFMAMLESSDPAVKAKAKLLRASSKTVRFASLYGAQAPNIAQQLMVDEDTAQKFLDAQDAATPRVNEWKAEVEEQAAKVGYAVDLVGCRRHLRDALLSDNKYDAARAARQASNFAIQASSAAQTKLAMASMWQSGIFTSGKFDAKFYFPVHDECVASVHKDDVKEFIRVFHACMTQPFAGMKIPIASSIEVGRDFGDLAEIGEQYNEAKVDAALADIFGGQHGN